jgi:hypothetical protein
VEQIQHGSSQRDTHRRGSTEPTPCRYAKVHHRAKAWRIEVLQQRLVCASEFTLAWNSLVASHVDRTRLIEMNRSLGTVLDSDHERRSPIDDGMFSK